MHISEFFLVLRWTKPSLNNVVSLICFVTILKVVKYFKGGIWLTNVCALNILERYLTLTASKNRFAMAYSLCWGYCR